MPENDTQNTALVAEGLTPGEAEYFTSGGTKTEGLSPPSDDGTAAATQPAPRTSEQQPAGISEMQRELKSRDEALAAERAATARERERATRLDERMHLYHQAMEHASQPAQPAAKPDPQTDPFGYMAWLGQQFEGLRGTTEKVAGHVQEREAATELRDTYVQDARAFAAKQSDFGPAYNWLMANRDAELAAAGYTDKAERLRIINADERDIVARALMARQQNRSAPGPAQIIYGLAKARGFAGAAPAPAARQPGNPGAPAQQGIDLAKIADMNDDDFMGWMSKLSTAQRKEFEGMIGATR